MEKVSVARPATVKPQGWVDAAFGMDGPRTVTSPQMNSYIKSRIC